MANEIDRLEIAIEAEASKANRALSSMEKRLNKIADSLQKVTSLSSAIDNFGNFDLKGFEKVQNQMDSIMSSTKKMGRTSASPKINDSNLKYAAKSMSELQRQFKDARLETKVSVMGADELRKFIGQTERSYNRMRQNLANKVNLEGSDVLKGKEWYRANMQLMQYENALDDAAEALGRLDAKQRQMKGFTIDRGQNTGSGGYEQKSFNVSPASLGYDADAMQMVFGEGAENLRNFNDVIREFGGNARTAGSRINEFEGSMNEEKVNTYEAQIKKLRQELASLANAGKGQGDADYDAVAKKIQRVTYAKKQYENNMKSAVKAEYESSSSTKSSANAYKTLKSSLSGINKVFTGISSGAKKALRGVQGFAAGTRSLVKGLASPISTLNKFKNELLGIQKQSRGRYGLPQMVGMSILFSTVFGMISGIKNAISEGSNNLVQYSQEYNQSISSIVSALTYLKNAWASAFAPIVNVVAPYLQKFINMIASALNGVGKFLAALTGKGFVVQAKKVFQDYGASLGDAGSGAADGLDDANKAAKELEKTVMGFDELNILSDAKNNGGSGAGDNGGSNGGLDLSPSDMFETIPVEGALADFGKKLRDAFLKEDWEGLGKIIADGINTGMQKVYDAISWNNVGPKITKFANAFTRTFNSLVDNIDFDLMGRTIGAGINTAVKTANLFIGDGGIDFKAIGTGISTGLRGAISEIPWTELGNMLGNWFMISWKILNGFVMDMSRKSDVGLTGWAELGKGFGRAINGAINKIDLPMIGTTIGKLITGIFSIFKNMAKEIKWKELGEQIAQGINNMFKELDPNEVADGINSIVNGIGDALGAALKNIDWGQIFDKMIQVWNKLDWKIKLGVVALIIGKALVGALGVVFANPTLFSGLAKTLSPGLATALGESVSSALASLPMLLTGAAGIGAIAFNVYDVFKGMRDSIKNKDIFGIVDSIKGFFSLSDIPNSMNDGIKKALSTVGFRNPIEEKFADSKEWLIEKGASTIYGFITGINNKYPEVSSFFGNLPANIQAVIGNANAWLVDKGRGVIAGLKSGYDSSKGSFLTQLQRLGQESFSSVGDIMGKLRTKGKDIVSGLTSGFQENKRSLTSMVSSIPDMIKSGIGDLGAIGKNAIASFARGFSSMHIPMPHLSVSFSNLKVGNTSIPIPNFGLNWYAKGGFPQKGELFVANEEAPEMVGKMGNRSTVANNRQITDGIAAAVGPAVYNAVTAALSISGGQSSGGDLYVTLDLGGERFIKKVVKDYNNMKQSDPSFGFAT